MHHSAFRQPVARPNSPHTPAAVSRPPWQAGSRSTDSGGWFVDGVDGDPSAVIGIGLPLTRSLLERVGLSIAELWAANPLALNAGLPLAGGPTTSLIGRASSRRCPEYRSQSVLATASSARLRLPVGSSRCVASRRSASLPRRLRPSGTAGHRRLAGGQHRPPGPGHRRVRRGRPALRHRAHPRRGEDRLAHRPQRPARARLHRRRPVRRADGPQGHLAATTPSSSTATRATGGRRTRCGCSRCSATPTSDCSTAAATCGCPTAATPPSTCRPSRPPAIRSSSATTPTIRAYKDDVLGDPRQAAADRRAFPAGVHRRAHHMPDYPEEGALRGGHIPHGQVDPVGQGRPRTAAQFRSRAELDELYGFLTADDKTVVYCRIGERSSHTWFVLTHLLGMAGVRNYDGSWTEWGNAVRVPVAVGEEPGEAPGVPMSPCRPRWPRWCRTSPTCRARTSCSCCWSSPNELPPLPSRSRRGGHGAGARVPVAAVPARRRRPTASTSGCTSARPPRRPRPAGSPRSWPRASTTIRPTRSWRCPTTSTPNSGLAALISPLRLRGMSAMLARIKRRLRG